LLVIAACLCVVACPVGLAGPAAVIELEQSFYAPSREVRTPHIAWANPRAGGRLRVLFLGCKRGMREVVELAQRLEMEYDFWGTAYNTMDHFPAEEDPWGGYSKGAQPEEHLARLKGLLQNDYDLFVLGPFDWKPFPLFAKYHILKQVKEGAGLVKMNSGSYGVRMDSFLERAMRNKIDVPRSFAEGLPWQALPVFASHEDTESFLSATVAAGQLGDGRIVMLKGYVVPEVQFVCPGFTPNPLWVKSHHQTARKDESSNPEFAMPISEVKLLDYDYYCAFMVRAMLFAAQRLPDIVIAEDGQVRKLDREDLAKFGFRVRCPTALPADARFVLRDRDNRVVTSSRREAVLPAAGEQRVEFAVPPIPAGRYFADLWIENGAGTLAFGSVALDVRSSPSIRAFRLERDSWRIGEHVKAAAEVELGDGPARDLTLVVRQRDNFGRLVGLEKSKVDGQQMALALAPVAQPLTVYQRLEVDLAAGDDVIDRKGLGFYLSDLPRREAIVYGTWERPFTSYLSFRMHQQMFKDGFDSSYFAYGSDYYMKAFGFDRSLNHGRAEIAVQSNLRYMPSAYKFRHHACWPHTLDLSGQKIVLEKGTRTPCLNDPEYRRALQQRVKDLLDHFGRFSCLEYICGDEMGFAHTPDEELCFSPHCKRFFRDYLKKQYGTIGRLNAEYGSNHKGFEEIEPVELEKALADPKLAPLWADFRMAMEANYSGTFAMMRETARALRPDIMFGYESSLHGSFNSRMAEDLWQISQWADIASPYECPFTGRARADFARRRTRLGHATNGFYAPCWSREFLGSSPWSDLFRGANFFLNWCGTYAYDFSIHGVFRPYMTQMREIKRGTGRLLCNAERETGSVALLLSQPSVHAWTLTEGDLKSRSMLCNYEAWNALLTDANIPFRVISNVQLAQGILNEGAFDLLVLPWSQALSPEGVAAVRAFAEQGGTVLADLRPAVRDGHCKPYETGALDDVFGVVQNTARADLRKDCVTVPFAAQSEPEVLAECRTDGSLSLGEGKALGRAGDVPVLIFHPYGKGQGVLLNFAIDPAVQFRESIAAKRIPLFRSAEAPRFLAFFKHLKQRLGLQDVVTYTPELRDLRQYRFSDGPTEYLGLLQELPEPVKRYASRTAAPLTAKRTVVRLRGRSHVYNVRDGRYLGLLDRFPVFVTPGKARLFALLPYRVDKVSVQCASEVTPGDELGLAVNIAAAAPTGRHVLRISVMGPDGREVQHYGRNVDADDGKFTGIWRTALDEAPGPYMLIARDAATGVEGRATVFVKQGK